MMPQRKMTNDTRQKTENGSELKKSETGHEEMGMNRARRNGNEQGKEARRNR